MSDFQMANLFPYIPFAGLLIAYFLVDLINGEGGEDDDAGGGGTMIPLYAPSPS